VACLRYFNPVGAHHSGEIGEDPKGVPNNLMPYINQVVIGKRKFLSVYGNDWPTHDGTGVRDYIHVVDLAQGHISALKFLLKKNESITVNLGTGIGYSVLDLIKAFEEASNQRVPYQVVERRLGDIAAFYADSTKAKSLLGWEPKHNLLEMCRDSWNWQKANPDGYTS
jgi:UDP-glucose 4-epimerase